MDTTRIALVFALASLTVTAACRTQPWDTSQGDGGITLDASTQPDLTKLPDLITPPDLTPYCNDLKIEWGPENPVGSTVRVGSKNLAVHQIAITNMGPGTCEVASVELPYNIGGVFGGPFVAFARLKFEGNTMYEDFLNQDGVYPKFDFVFGAFETVVFTLEFDVLQGKPGDQFRMILLGVGWKDGYGRTHTETMGFPMTGATFTLAPECPTLRAGDLFTVPRSMTFVYNADERFLYFADPLNGEPSVFESWRADNNDVIEISPNCYHKLQLPDNGPYAVSPRPGSYVAKYINGNGELYVVLPNYNMAKITPQAARDLYQPADVGGFDETPITIGLSEWVYFNRANPDIVEARVHPGMIFQIDQNPTVYYANQNGTVSQVTDAGFSANHFQRRFLRRVPNSAVAGMVAGPPINQREPAIDDITQGN